jgi:hypothetical protein
MSRIKDPLTTTFLADPIQGRNFPHRIRKRIIEFFIISYHKHTRKNTVTDRERMTGGH